MIIWVEWLCRAGGDVVLQSAEVVKNLGDSSGPEGIPCGDVIRLGGKQVPTRSGEDLQPSILVCEEVEWGQVVAKRI